MLDEIAGSCATRTRTSRAEAEDGPGRELRIRGRAGLGEAAAFELVCLQETDPACRRRRGDSRGCGERDEPHVQTTSVRRRLP